MATSFLLRKSLTIPGAITLTGNTLGLSDKNYPYRITRPEGLFSTRYFGYGAHDIGTFITTNTGSQVSGYPAGTTNNWSTNSSSAILRLPAGAKVVYAELIWGGETRSNGFDNYASQNVDGSINTPVRFIVPGGTTYNISPDPATNGIATIGHDVIVQGNVTWPYTGGDAIYYVRSQNVTSIVQQFGAGQYTCGGVAAAINPLAPGGNRCAGWDLLVMYELSTLSVKNLTFFIGIEAVGGDSVSQINYTTGGFTQQVQPGLLKGPREIDISGFVTPASGTVRGRLLVSAMAGDALFTWNAVPNQVLGIGDVVKFGPSAAQLTTLAGPNNPADNFLTSQINGDNGLLDTSGTFGGLNNNPNAGVIGEIKRQGWDISNVNVSGLLGNSQTSAAVTIQSVSDEYAMHLLALEIEVNAPKITLNKTVDKQVANTGDELLYTVTIRNDGSTAATNVIFVDTVPSGTNFIPGSVTVNGTANTTAIPNAPGFSIPDLPPGGVVTVTYKVKIGNALPSPNPIPNKALVGFNYVQAPGLPTQSGSSESNTVNTLVGLTPNPDLTSIKQVNTTSTVVGDNVLYTVTLINTGNVQLNNVVFIDTAPNGTTFIPGSLIIDNNSSTLNPQNGIPVGTLAVGEQVTFNWYVNVFTMPNPNPFVNTGVTNFTYATSSVPNNPGSKPTNSVQTSVQDAIPNIQITKEVNKTEAAVGESITYTVTYTNKGNITLTNLIFQDTLSNGLQFVPQSVVVDGNNIQTADPQIGFLTITTLPVGLSVQVQFAAIITTVPNPNPIPNVANVTYNFKPAPGATPVTGAVTSNQVNTNVFEGINPVLTLQKDVSIKEANIGDTISYTIAITNNGNVPLYDVHITDNIPNGTAFVPGSFALNFVSLPNGNPVTGVTIPNLPVDGVAFISFDVIVNQLPIPNPIPNKADGAYKYVDVTGNTIPTTTISNTVTTLVSIPRASSEIVKTTDKGIATVGEEITYTVRFTNTGGIPLTNGFFVDTLPNGTVYVPGTVTLNGIAVASANPQTGFSIGTVPAGGVAVVQFKVVVDTLPTPNPLLNGANITYKYTTNAANPNGNNGSVLSNIVPTTIIQPTINVSKAVDKTSANLGDSITYTLVVNNPNSIPLTNIIIRDTIPNGTTFVANSVLINNNPTSANPQTGINIGDLQPGATSTITFQITVTSPPNPNPIPNTFNAIYNYRPSPTSPLMTSSAPSNTVNTLVSIPPGNASTTVIKSVDKTTANIGETVSYTSVITNTGDLPLTNVIFTDTLQATNIGFIQGSVTVNGVSNAGNPSSGINIGNLAVGQVATIIFQVTITGTPVPNPIPNTAADSYTYTPNGGSPTTGGNVSNQVNTNVNQPGTGDATTVKSVDKTTANVGDELTYTSVITNTGSLPLTNVIFTDAIEGTNTTFVANSVTVNGVSNGGNPAAGINIGSLSVGQVVTVVFRVKLNGVPVPNPLPNKSNTAYTYTPQGGSPTNGNKDSNIVNTQVNQPGSGNTSVVKTVDKTTANIGDTITYTSAITNTGSLPLTNVIFTDTLQATNIGFVPGSVTVNGVSNSGNPSSGINVGSLAVGQVVTIIFQVTIVGTPVPNPIPNTSSDSYSYTPQGGSPTTGSNTSNQVNTNVNPPSGTGEATTLKAVDKTTANIGDELTYTSLITNTGNLPLTNVVFTDAIEATNVTFVPGSLTVNGVPNGGNPASGVSIGNLALNGTALVQFKVKINGTPVPNPIPNKANTSYFYTPPGGTTNNGNKDSNTVNTNVNPPSGQGSTSVVKSVDKTTANVGDQLTYTVVVTNNGTLPVDNVVVTDAIEASNVVFVPGSLTINGTSSLSNPATGVNIGTLAVGQVATLTYRVSINGTPVPNPIPNTASDAYTYTPIGGQPTNGSNSSNQVNTQVNTPTPGGEGNATGLKSTDKTTANIGDTITYTAVVTNTGTLPLTNVIYTDQLQSTNTSFVPGSVTVNGSSVAGTPQSGIPVGSLAVGQSATVVFKIVVNGVPVPNPIPNSGTVGYTYTPTGGQPTTGSKPTNTVTTSVTTPAGTGDLTLLKSTDRNTAKVGDTITYTLIATNTGNLPLTNVVVTDPITSSNVTFVPGSVTVDGVTNIGNPASGINIGNLAVGASKVIIFKVTVSGTPSPNPIVNIGNGSYTYTPNGGSPTTGNKPSNPVTTTVTTPSNSGDATVSKAVDKSVASVGDQLTYTVTVTNTGALPLTNVNYTDVIEASNVTFVPGSVTVNGASNSGNPASGVSIGNLAVGQSAIVTFKVTVNGTPAPNPIPNTGTAGYTYTPAGGSPVTTSKPSNTVYTQVNPSTPGGEGNVTGLKSTDKTTANVGDTITYTAVVTNTGTLPLTNVIYTDQLQSTNTSVVPGSVTVNGTAVGGTPQSGIPVGSLAVGQSATVVFKIVVNGIPVPNPIPNAGNIGYTYTPPGGQPTTGSKPTNTVTTSVTTPAGTGDLTLLKSTDKNTAQVGDTITYTLIATNTGNLPLTNVVVNDPITSSNVNFVTGSVTVDGTSNPGSPITGINVGNLAVGESKVIRFKVTISGTPTPNPIVNIGTGNFTYTPNGGTPTTGTKPSNPVTTTVTTPSNSGDATVSKAVDKAVANVGDQLTYTVTVTNTGALPLTNVNYTDVIEASNVTFVTGSVTVNGASAAGSPQSGISVGNLAVGQSAIITFRVTVNGVPVPNPIPNTGTAAYTYTPQGGSPTTANKPSNTVYTQVNKPSGGIAETTVVKAVDKTTANVGDTLTYNILVTNTGSLPVNNLILTDQIQSTNVSFVPGSLTVNGVPNGGNPQSGVSLGNLAVGGVALVSFRVTINGTPNPNPIPNTATTNYSYTPPGGSPTNGTNSSNTVNTNVNPSGGGGTGSVNALKTADKTTANVGDTITYTTAITNNGTLPLTNVVFTDQLPATNTAFVPGSVTINGTPSAGSPQSGVTVGNLAVGQVVTITFKLTVNGVPTPNPIPNKGTASYSYTPPGGQPTTGTTDTNTVTTSVTTPNGVGDLTILKSTDKNTATVGETITYTAIMTNTGNLTLSNVVFTDPISSSNISYVPGSVTVDGIANGGSPLTGVQIGTLNVGQSVVVKFKVTVNGTPSPNPIVNIGTGSYTYTPNGGSPTSGSKPSNPVTTTVTQPSNTGDASIVKSVDKNVGKIGDTLTYTSVITNTGILPLTNVVFTDQLASSNVTFVANSATVNGIPAAGSIQSGIPVGNIPVGGSATVVFKVTVNGTPSPNPIPNTSATTFSYTPTGGSTVTVSKPSNTVNTLIETGGVTPTVKPDVNTLKSADKTTANIGDTITYTAVVTNTGNIGLNNVVYTDQLEATGISYVPGSVTLNGSAVAGNPQTGISIGNLPVGGSATVAFKVTINGTPNPNPIPNKGTTNYSYTPPGGQPSTGSKDSNTVTTSVTTPNGIGDLTILKTSDKTTAQVGDTITYSAIVTNTGNLPLTNVIFTDPITSSNVSFVPGSVTVNGSSNSGNPTTGVTVGNLAVGESATVVFKVTITGNPTPNPIRNVATGSYTYTPNGGTPTTGTKPSNETNTTVGSQPSGGNAAVVKSVDKLVAKSGDTLTYTSVITNNGTLQLNNVVFTDQIAASNVSFVPGSVTVNGVSNSGNPQVGINVGNIPVGGSVTVVFKATVNGTPAPNPIPNTGAVNYTYTPQGGSPTTGSNPSNTVYTQVSTITDTGNLTMLKNVDKTTANIGDVLTYNVLVTNTGNVPVSNVIFTDPITSTNVSYVPGTLTVNGVPNLGNPQSGVNIGNLPIGGIVLVTFRVTVNGNPSPNPIKNTAGTTFTYTPPGGQPTNGTSNSNTVQTQVNQSANQPITQITKQVDKTVTGTNSELTYTLTASNTGSVAANNVVVTDPIPQGTTFVNNSVSINGVSSPGTNPQTGIPIGTVAPGQSVVITFKVLTPANSLPQPNPINNQGTLTYNYQTSPTAPPTQVTLPSNPVTTTVNAAIIPPGTNTANPGIVKSVDKNVAQIGDTITYTIKVTNSGNISTDSTTIIDTIPTGTVFVTGSVTVNGTPNTSANPAVGVPIGQLAPGATSTIQFKVTVVSNPPSGIVKDVAIVNYSYRPDPASPTTINTGSPSNEVNTTIGNPPINPATDITKSVDKAYVQVGDIITYTVNVTNSGKLDATNVLFKDTIPNGTSFVDNSVTVNGTGRPGANPQTGFTLGTITPGATAIITFKVKVNSLPSPNIITNVANITYTYQPDPTKPPITTTVPSPPTTTGVNQAVISNGDGGLSKAVDKAYATVGEVLTYTVTLRNTGNTAANNVVLTDPAPAGTEFVLGSVVINGVQSATSNPESGIPVGTINPNGTAVVSYKVKVTKIPVVNPIPNKADVSYNYTVDPNNPNGVTANNTSNQVTTLINQGNIDPNNGVVKTADKTFVSVGDIVTYTVKVTNSGNTMVENVIFRDTIGDGLVYIPNTFTVNGGIIPGANLQSGVNIGSITPGATKVVEFKVTVTTIPSINPIPNVATVNYQYVVNPNTGETGSGTSTSKPVNVTVNQANIDPNSGVIKSVDKEYAQIGDTLTYTIKVTNSGNIPAQNVVFYDTIPVGTNFVVNSVTVDGVNKVNQSPASGVALGTINPNQSAIVTFKVTVISLPSNNIVSNSGRVTYSYTPDPSKPNTVDKGANSNTVTTNVSTAIIDPNNGGLTKTADKKYVKLNDVITYTVTLNNTGNTPATNVILKDTVPSGTVFVTDSVKVNGTTVTGVSPESGIPVGILNPNKPAIVEFKVLVTTVPTPNVITNVANVTYNYTVNPNNPNGGTGGGSSKPVTVTVNSADIDNPSGGLIKKVDKEYASVNDILTYTVLLKNTGNVSAQNVVIIDTIPNGTQLIDGSVQINGQTILGANPNLGIQVGTIAPNGTVTLIYKVKVTSIPNPNPIPNTATVNYSFIVDPSNPVPQTATNVSNVVQTTVNSPNIVPNNGSVVKSVDKAYAKVGDTLTYTITVSNKGNTPATNVIITDTVPTGTKFVTNSVTVNGTTQVGANPTLGVIVPDILPGTTTILTYQAVVTEIPIVNPIINVAKVDYSYTKDPNKPNGDRVTVPTNETQTQVNSAEISPNNGGLTKAVDKQYADVGDIVTYTITAKNTGNVSANNLVIYDTIPYGTTYVQGSLRVNGLDKGDNPQTGISVGNLAPNETAIISFKVTVTTLVNPNVIKNSATASYNFTTNPQSPNGEHVTNQTNEVQTVINSASINNANGGLTKTVDKEYASVGDTITYTVTMTNKGNVAAENVTLVDTIPEGTQFVNGSVIVNGVSQSAANPQTGILVGLIPVSGKAVVQFKVLVTSIPKVNPIPNTGRVTYRYLVNPSTGAYKTTTNSTNTVLTKVNTADLSNANGGATKSVDKPYADINDVVTYTIKLQNKGNVPAINVVVRDTIPKEVTFISNSVTVNGVVQIDANPNNGIYINSIAPGETIEITFKARVDSVPNPNIISNRATVNYSYIVDPTSQQQIDKGTETNPATITVNSGNITPINGGFQKTADKQYASIGEEISYTISVRNTGNVPVNNVIVQDTAPEGTTFINDSILVNGVRRAGDNLTSGINLGTLQPQEQQIITFKVLVTSIPKINPIPNKADVTYTYTVDPNKPNGASGNNSTNTVFTQINYADISANNGGITKSVDKVYASLGNKLLYTITLKNKGNVNANNIVLYDTIPNGTTFVPNSVLVNNVNVMGANPETGINVGILEPNKIAIVQFQVNVTSIPSSNNIKNQGLIDFTYTKDPSQPNGVEVSNGSNVVTTTVSSGIITPGTIPIDPITNKPLPPTGGFIKTSDKVYAMVGETISYTMKIENSGNVQVTNVFVKDTLPNSLKFVEGSLSVDGVTNSTANINNGVNIGTIGPKQYKNITFKAIVVSIPESNPIVNKAYLTYEYVTDPTKPPIKGNSSSNDNNITINGALISPVDGGFIKEVDKTYAELNDLLTYTIIVKNTGNVKANNVIVKDTIPVGTEFIPSSVTVNGVNDPTLTPQTGIGILVLNPGANAVITFKVKVVSINLDNKIRNNATVSYDFILNPDKPLVSQSAISNTVITNENSVNFSGNNFVKSVDNKFASLGDNVEYTFTIRNGGNIIATNVFFRDTIPDALQFVAGSFKANGITLVNADPQIGVALGTIGINEVITVNFTALVISIPRSGVVENVGILTYASQVNPNNNPVVATVPSNVEDVKILDPAVKFTKAANKTTAVVGDTVTYTLVVADTGNVDILNVRVVDELSEDLEFVGGSVQINGVSIPSDNIVSGITIDKVKAGTSVTITFKAKVISLPKNGVIANKANVNYSYITDPNEGPRGNSQSSNGVNINVEESKVIVTKSSDKTYAKIEDVVTYTVIFENVGTIVAKNLIFFDSMPAGVTFVQGSFTINGRKINSVDVSKGVTIGNLKPGEKAIVSYKVIVNSVDPCRKITNVAYGKYEYQINPKAPLVEKTTEISKYTLYGQSPNFKQMNMDGIITLGRHMPPIEEVNEVSARIEITNQYAIDTIKAVSSENAKLTGQKLVINGFIHETVEYTSCTSVQSVHYTCQTKKFSTFIVIEEGSLIGAHIQTEAIVEDVSFTQLGDDSIYTNITFNIDALIQN